MSLNDTSTNSPSTQPYEAPQVTDLGTLMQVTAGTGTVATRDPQGTSV